MPQPLVRPHHCSRVSISLAGAVALVFAPLLNGCAMAPQTVQQQQASACGGIGAGLNKTDIGILAGTAAGAFVGNMLAGSQNKLVGTIFGAAAGGAIGGVIGSKLDAQDCESLTAQLDSALQYSQNGSSTNWSASKADVHARFRTSATRKVTQQVSIIRASGVAAPEDLVVQGKIGYAANDPTEILSEPSATAKSLGTLGRGDALRIIGYPRQHAGYDLIARGGIAIGYVSTADVSHSPITSNAATPENMAVVAPVRAKPDLESVGGYDPPVTQVTATVECRTVSTTMSGSGVNNGTPTTNSATACQTPDGAWNLQDTGVAM